MMTLRQAALEAVQWFRDHPEQHLTQYYSLAEDGALATPTDPTAHCFCFMGRILHNLGETIPGAELDPFRAVVMRVTGDRGVIALNDEPRLSLSEKLEIFERAAQLLPEGG